MRELELTVRISMDGEYLNTETFEIEIPEDTSEDDEMGVMMTELHPLVEAEYGDTDEWENGEVSWTLEEWEDITC